MRDWNVVVSVKERGFAMARDLLRDYGEIGRTTYHNVLVMKVPSPEALLARIEQRLQVNRDLLAYVSRIAPATHTFDFATPEEFDVRLRESVPFWTPDLAGKTFHARMHRRGLKGVLRSPDEERLLDGELIAALQAAGTPGAIRFEDPDAVIDIETLDKRAGMALWSREALRRYPFLRPE